MDNHDLMILNKSTCCFYLYLWSPYSFNVTQISWKMSINEFAHSPQPIDGFGCVVNVAERWYQNLSLILLQAKFQYYCSGAKLSVTYKVLSDKLAEFLTWSSVYNICSLYGSSLLVRALLVINLSPFGQCVLLQKHQNCMCSQLCNKLPMQCYLHHI